MVWLIGCRGMLGTEISLLLDNQNVPYMGTDKEVDITNAAELDKFAEGKSITWLVNCAAYTAVDKAEDDVESCKLLNTTGAANIALCAKKINAKLIHLSTDYVFDGKGSVPYKEDEKPNPIGVYGLTKRDGEIAVLENNSNSYIIRIAWLYGKHGNNFVHTMIKLMNERDELKIVNDQYGSPTWSYDLTKVILRFVKESDSGKNIPFGVYHFTNEGKTTWCDFAKEIYKQGRELGLIKNRCNILPCTSAEFPAKVKRPMYSVLDKEKIKNTLGIEIPNWDKGLKEFLTSCVN